MIRPNKKRLRLLSIVAVSILLATLLGVFSFVEHSDQIHASALKNKYDLPSWWHGQHCNKDDHPGSYVLGNGTAVWRGIEACGPLPGTGPVHNNKPANFGSELEWECTELVKRYLYLAYGLSPKDSTNGSEVVDRYTADPISPFFKITNDINHSRTYRLKPVEGDVLSWSTVHTAIVTDSNNVVNGTGNVSILEQNWSDSGFRNIHMTKWVFDDTNISAWMTLRPGGWYTGYTPTDFSKIKSSSSLEVSFRADDKNGRGIDHVDITYRTKSSNWKKAPNVQLTSVSGQPTQRDAYVKLPITMPSNEWLEVSADVYSGIDINFPYALAPRGIRHFCPNTQTTPCDRSQFPLDLTYAGPSDGNSQNIGGNPNQDHPQTTCEPTATQAVLFTGENLTNQCVVLNPGRYETPEAIGLPNDSIVSAKLGAYVEVNACQNTGLNAPCEVLQSGQTIPNLATHSINRGTISSLEVRAKGGINACHNGNCTLFGVGVTNVTGDPCVDEVKFDQFDGVYHLVLWSGKDKTGNPSHFDHNTSGLHFCGSTQIGSVEVYPHMPPNASQQSPENGSVFPANTTSVDLTYDGGNQFQIHVWGSAYDHWQNWTSDKAIHLTGLQPGTYSWQVQGQNEHGVGPWSETRTFTITDATSTNQPTARPSNTPPVAVWVNPHNGFVYEPGIWYNMTVNVYPASQGDAPVDQVIFYGYWSGNWHELCRFTPHGDGTSAFTCSSDFRYANNNVYPPAGQMQLKIDASNTQGGIGYSAGGVLNGTYQSSTFGGHWDYPANGFSVQHGASMHMVATVYPANNGPAIDHVVYYATWPALNGAWIPICPQVGPGFVEHQYDCYWNLKDTNGNPVPIGQITLKWDVYDANGSALYSPDGTRQGTVS